MPAKEAQNPLILHYHRLMEAFSKSDDERDFYLDKVEGFILYVDLNKGLKELNALDEELRNHSDRYFLVPKLTFYETKKVMEGFVNEKVFDIDTKEKLMDIIGSKISNPAACQTGKPIRMLLSFHCQQAVPRGAFLVEMLVKLQD